MVAGGRQGRLLYPVRIYGAGIITCIDPVPTSCKDLYKYSHLIFSAVL